MIPIPFAGFSDPVSSSTHLLGALGALIGTPFLIGRGRGNAARITALVVFSFALVFLFSMSGVFHLLARGGAARDIFQRLDHAGIWLLIAGTFTPIHIILFRGFWRWALLTMIWTFAITGLTLEVVFFTSFPEWLLLSLFLGLGWMGALSGSHFFLKFRCRSISLLILGGLSYSVGAAIDFFRWPVLIEGVLGPHEIFHIFVLLGAFSHWLFVYRWSHHPVRNEVTFNVHILPSRKVVARARGEHFAIEAESVEAFRAKVVSAVTERFHQSIRPRIRLIYHEEEHL